MIQKLTLWANLITMTTLGSVMIVMPNLMKRLVYVPEPNILIQTIGVMGMSIGLLCWLTLLNSKRNKSGVLNETSLFVLLLFNAGLAMFLGIAAYNNLISWLGLIVHLPLAIACAASLIFTQDIKRS